MVGLIQRILLHMIEQEAGPDARARVLRGAGLPETMDYRIDRTYDDEEFLRLFGVACSELGVTQAQAEITYADYFGRDALERFPAWFEVSEDARSFLLRQPLIHNCIAESISNRDLRRAVRDKFSVRESDGQILTRYESRNRMCGLYVALASWVLHHYEETADIVETSCMKAGAPCCEIEIRWKTD